MTIPKAQQVEHMSNVIVERRPKSPFASRDAVLPPGTPTPRRADPLYVPVASPRPRRVIEKPRRAESQRARLCTRGASMCGPAIRQR